jgi:hypothetical protein
MSEMPLNGICGGLKELAGRGGKEMFGSNFQVGLVGTRKRFGGASTDLATVLRCLILATSTPHSHSGPRHDITSR